MNKNSRKGVKLFTLFMLLLSLALGANAHPVDMSQTRDYELTVYDGTTTNNYVPAYVYYFDDFSRSQFVIPAADLTSMYGCTIDSVKFYTTSNNIPYTTVSTVDIYLKEVDYTEISAFEDKADCQVVYTGTMDFFAEEEDGACVITFDTPFTYYGGNLLVGCENTTDDGWKYINFYGQTVNGASVAGSNGTSPEDINATQRNFIPKTTFYYTIGDIAPNFVATPNPIDLGHRPNGAWMRPFEVNIFNQGFETTVNDVSVTNGYFQLNFENLTVPFVLNHNTGFDFNLSTVGTASGEVDANLIVNYGDNEETQFDVTASAYTPVSPDVWELATTVSSFPYTATLNANSVPLYDNYRLPPASIADGADAVYKLVFTEDSYLNASVTSGEDGKVALYPEGFYGEGGPDLNNNYTAPETPIEEWLYYDNGEYYESWYTNWGDCIWGIKFSPDQLAAYANCNLTKISMFDSNSNYGLSTYTINIYVGGDTPDEGILVHTQDFEPYVDNTFHEVFLTEAIDIDPSQNLWITLHAQANGGYPIACCRNVEDPNGRWYYYDSSWTEFTGFNDAAWMLRGFVTNASGRTIALGDREETIDVTIGDESSTTTATYSPFHTLWNYSLSENLFLASELAEAGMTTAPMTKLSWFVSSTSCTTPQNGISIWMANVPDTELTDISHTTESMTLVYTGENILPTIGQWNEFVFNESSFAWDGISNVLILCQRNNGSWQGSVSWQTHNPGFTGMSYAYNDNDAYDALNSSYTMYTTATNRPNTRFTIDNIFEGTITNMTVTPGTYYLVASSTSNEWSLEINADEVPCPAPAYSPAPANHAEVNPNRTIELSWKLGMRTTEYKLMFGTTESCEQTLVDWTSELGHYYTLPALLDETTYYWKIVERNDGCSEGVEGPVWSFTTRLNTPQNLYAEEDFIMDGSGTVLYWSAPSRALLSYNVYQDGVLIGNTTDTYFVVDGLSYNMNGYAFYVTGVFDAGESDPSNYAYVFVSGLGYVAGHVYEQDGATSIGNATVTFTGYDEYGYYNTYSFTTEADGYYEGNLRAGSYVAMASCPGYQDGYYGGSVSIIFNVQTSGINISLDELFNPVNEVVAEYYPDAENPESPYVKIYWGFDNPSSWLYYDDGINVDGIGYGTNGSFYWGVKFDVSGYTNHWLSKVSMYDRVAHTGTILIYQGGETAPEVLLYQQSYSGTGCGDFVNYDLNNPISINPSQSLWIVMNNDEETGDYPASCSNDTGDPNGRWVSIDGTSWEDLANYSLNYTWMLRGYLSNGSGRGETMIANNLANPNQQPSDLVISPRNGSGNGVLSTASNVTPHNVGTPVAIDMEEFNRSLHCYRVYRTNAYNNGPYNVENTVLVADNVTDTELIDVTWQDIETGVYKWGVSCVYEGNRESEISWGELNQLNLIPNRSSRHHQAAEGTTRETLIYDFDDSSLQGWTTIDADGDGYTWVSSATPGDYHNSGIDLTGTGHNGSAHYVISCSYANGLGYALTPDNYLVSPQIALGGSISFYACAQDASWAAEHFGVAISNNGTTGWTMVQEWTMTAKSGGNVMSVGRNSNTRAQGNWYQYTVDLSAYAGQNGYVAIRHFNCSDQFILNVDDITIVEGDDTGGLQGPRESEIVWSNFLDKDMYLFNGDVNLTVTLNSGDSPEGTTVRFINLNSIEQQQYPIADIILDATGYYALNSFRKGDYQVTITKNGYETIIDNVSIWDPTNLSYMMTEIIYGVIDLYVSRTGWAKWDGHGEPSTPGPGPGGVGDSFSVDFESGMPAGWTTIDADGDGFNWSLGSTMMGAGYGHNGSSDLILSQSYDNTYGALNPDNYLVSPAVNLDAGSTFSFWACAQDNAWASEHFGVAVSDNGTSDWTMVQEWTMTAKGEGGKVGHSRNGGNRAQGNWYQYTVDLSAFAGQKYIAIRHFNCTDWFYLDVDDITLTSGAKPGDRHLEYYQVICESINHEPIFSINTPHNFCQLATNGLVEGEHYLCKVAAVYSTGMSAWTEPVEWEYEPCDHWGPVDDVVVYANDQGNRIEWIFENGYNPYGGNKSSLEFDSQPSNVMGDDTDYLMLSKGGEFYSQYAEDGLMLNFFALDNVDLRAYLLYNLSNDSRFTLVPEEEYGQFILTSNDANNNFMDAFETAYQNAMVDFSLMSKVDIDDHLVAWKSSVAPTNYLSIMMDVITAQTRNENDHCINSIPFCTSDVITFNAASTSQTADELEGTTLQDGCIGYSYNPSWYHMRIHTAGQFVIHMEGHDPVDPTILRDIDYCIWGPFTNPYLPCTSDLTIDKIIDCNYSPSYSEDVYLGYHEDEHQHESGHGTVNYHMPEIGEYYILMITNYSRQSCNITFTKAEGIGETDSNIINTTGIIGFLITEDDEYVAIASPDDRDYTVEGEFGEHEYCVRPIYPGEMHLPAQNYGWSMGCPQTASNDEEYHWNVDIYQYPYNMSVTGIIQINGVEQQTPTLEIGAFCGDECRGTQRLTYFPQVDRYLVFFTLYGDAGDVMNFRLYDHVAGQELDIACSSTISFVPDGFMGTPFDPYVFDFGNMAIEQVSNFSQGYNWWGTYIEQNGIDGLSMLQDGLGDNGITIRSQASGYNDFYSGYGWFGSLSGINNESSYRVITSAPCTVTMTGDAAVPSEHPITVSQGWTWIGYVPSTAMDVNVAMAGINASNGDKLKSQQGYADYYPGYGWFGSLTTIEPCMGLMYYSINSQPVTFTYPNGRSGALKANITAENNHWIPNVYAYPDNMTLMAIVELNNEELHSENYELAAFDNSGKCRGSVKLMYAEPLHRHVAFLTISGKDTAELSFRLYNTETNEEYYDAEESLNFVADAIVGEATDLYTIHFRGTTGVDEFAGRVKVYPNPVNAGERFSIGMDVDIKSSVRVEIVNALGTILSVETSDQLPATIKAPTVAGVYTLRIACEEGTCYRKMVVR